MISRALLFKELRQLRWKLVIGLLLLSVLAAGYPFLHDWTTEFLRTVPDAPLPFGLSRESLLSLADYTAAVYSNWNAKNLLQLGTLFAILLGMSLLANEYETDTISWLLCAGLDRSTVFWTKVTAGLIALGILILVPTLLILPATACSGHQFAHLRWLSAVAVESGGLACWFAVSVWFSTRMRDGLKAGLYSAAVAILLMLFGVVPGLSGLSPFKQMAASAYVLGMTGFPWLVLLGFVALTALILWSAYRHFRYRDV